MKLRSVTVVVIVAVLAMLAMPSYSALPTTELEVQSISMPLSDVNNVAFFGKYALVAPTGVSEEPNVTPEGASTLYIVNTEDPKERIPISLGELQDPTTLIFDGERVFVRGTVFEKRSDGTLSGLSHEVIAYTTVQLRGDNGKPVGSSQGVVIVDIPGCNGERNTSSASPDMVLAHDGHILVFSNGRQVFAFSVEQGYLFRADVVSCEEYGPDSFLSFAGSQGDTFVVSHNITKHDEKGDPIHKTDLLFYAVEKNGVLSTRKIVKGEGGLPSGAWLTDDSNVVFATDTDDQAKAAYFVTSDGKLCMVNLRSDLSQFEEAKVIGQFPSLAGVAGREPGPRILRLDDTKRLFISNPGEVPMGIRRPVFIGKPKVGIRRPVFISSRDSVSILSAELLKQNRIGPVTDLTSAVAGESALTGLIASGGKALISTQSGRLLTVEFVEGTGAPEIKVLGTVGFSVDYLTLNWANGSIVAVSSVGAADADVSQVLKSGALVILYDKEGSVSAEAISDGTEMCSSPGQSGWVSSQSKSGSGIRRPCNVLRRVD